MTGAPRPRLLVNMGVLGACQVLTQLLNLASLIAVARILSDRDFGLVQMGVVLSHYALLLGEMGLLALGIRSISRMDAIDQVREYVRVHLGLLIVLAVVVTGLGLALLPATPFYAEAPAVFVLYLLFVIPQVYMNEWITTGLQRLHWTGLFWVMRSATYALLIFLLLPRIDGTLGLESRVWVPAFYLLAFVAADLMMATRIRNILGAVALVPRWGPAREWRARLEDAIPIGITNVVMRILMTVDLLVLGWLEPPEVVGLYAAAAKPVAVLLIATSVAWKALLPRLSRLWFDSRGAFADQFGLFCGLAVVALAPVAIGGVVLGDDLIALLYGGRYEGAGSILAMLAIAYPLLALGIFLGNGLLASDRQRGYLPRVVVAAASLIALEIVLVPRFGAMGAARAMVIGAILLVLTCGSAMRSSLGRPFWRNVALAAIASAVMFGTVELSGSAPLLLRMLAGVVGYGVIAVPVVMRQVRGRLPERS